MDLVIFDLDGTLIDSKQDLANAVNAAREHLGLPPIADEKVHSYVGNGAPVLIRRALGPEASDQDIQRALDYFLKYYADHKLDYTCAYPGVPEALERLHEAGVRMSVLTNKPVRISKAIVEGLGMVHFSRVYGGNSFAQKKPDPVGVHTLLAELGVPPDRALMVGDSSVDVLTARNAGIRSCGVTYGFQPESLNEPAPDFLAGDMGEVADLVIEERKRRTLQS